MPGRALQPGLGRYLLLRWHGEPRSSLPAWAWGEGSDTAEGEMPSREIPLWLNEPSGAFALLLGYEVPIGPNLPIW